MRLTTDHSSSSYGQAVLVAGGRAYSPGDVTPSGLTGAEYVAEHPASGADDDRQRYLAAGAAMGLIAIQGATTYRTDYGLAIHCDPDGIRVVDWGTAITTDYGHAMTTVTPDRRDYSLHTEAARAIARRYTQADRLHELGATARWSWSAEERERARGEIRAMRPGMGGRRAYNTGLDERSRAHADAEEYVARILPTLRRIHDRIEIEARAEGRTVWGVAVDDDRADAALVPYPVRVGADLDPLHQGADLLPEDADALRGRG